MSTTVVSPAPEKPVTRREFAELLGVTVETLDRWRPRLPAPIPLPGRRVVWLRETVTQYLRGQRAGALAGNPSQLAPSCDETSGRFLDAPSRGPSGDPVTTEAIHGR
jgi:hypothetical protein